MGQISNYGEERDHLTTIKDIARIAGVSYSTVSKALNDSPLVRPDTKRRILEIAQANNYNRNILARQLASGRSKMIGLVLKDVTNPVFSNLATEMHRTLKELGYSMILALSSDGIELLENLRVDGLLYWGNVHPSSSEADKLSRLSVPVLTLGNEMTVPLPSLKVNRKGGMAVAVKHLYQLGHRKIGLIGDSQETKTRLFRESMTEMGLPINANSVLPGRTTWEDGYHAVKNLHFSGHEPTAFIGVNNRVTRGALRAFMERKIRIPTDVSLLGYDDLPEMEQAEVPLTTVGPAIEDVAAVAAEMMLQLMVGEPVEALRSVEPILHRRQSTGPCPNTQHT